MMGYGDMAAGYGWIWMTAGLVFWGLLIAFAVHAFSRTAGDRPGAPAPEEILRRRYAQGEIDDAEYEARQRVIHG